MANQDSTAPLSPDERAAVARLLEMTALDLLTACNEALDAAIDLSRPQHTTARCLSAQSALAVALKHPERAEWAANRLRQLAADWRADR